MKVHCLPLEVFHPAALGGRAHIRRGGWRGRKVMQQKEFPKTELHHIK
ncbi:MAG: hypothetical protein JWO06_1373 [Bacteroidota bacterium]|nr:hypothetical protein [Bacteroidota bacterium]